MISPFLEQVLYVKSFRQLRGRTKIFFLESLLLENDQLKIISIPQGKFWNRKLCFPLHSKSHSSCKMLQQLPLWLTVAVLPMTLLTHFAVFIYYRGYWIAKSHSPYDSPQCLVNPTSNHPSERATNPELITPSLGSSSESFSEKPDFTKTNPLSLLA